MNTREGKPTPPWMEFIEIEEHRCNNVKVIHRAAMWRSHKARYDFDNARKPHQGKAECARRRKP